MAITVRTALAVTHFEAGDERSGLSHAAFLQFVSRDRTFVQVGELAR